MFKKCFLKNMLIALCLIPFALIFSACKDAGKKTQAAPNFAIELVTDTSIIVTPIEGAEYSNNGAQSWQNSNVFSGLKPNTTYAITIRLKENSTHFASPSAQVKNISTSFLNGILITSAPTVKFEAGENFTIEGGKINLLYFNTSYMQEVEINPQWVTLNDDATATVSYLSFSDTCPINSSSQIVSVANSSELAQAFNKNTTDAIVYLIKNGDYEISTKTATMHLKKPMILIGFGEVNITFEDQILTQASVLFTEETTIKNINFSVLKEKSPIKFAQVDQFILAQDRMSINKLYLENITTSGKSGINVQGIKNAVLNNVNILIESAELGCVALSAAEIKLTLNGCNIGNGAWGSFGVMFKPGSYVAYAHVDIINSTFTDFIYVEYYEEYKETVITGLEDWTVEEYKTTGLKYFKT